jgi:hypothetical protein
MDLHVLFDRSGKILAAVDLRRETDAVPLPRPVAQRAQRTADVVVPEEFRGLDFLEICTSLIVQAKGDRVTLVARKEPARPRTGTRSRPPKTPGLPGRKSKGQMAKRA